MDRGVLFWILFLNVVAVAIIYGRMADTELALQLKTRVESGLDSLVRSIFSSKTEEIVCGYAPWNNFIILSERVVLPSGVQPAAIYISKGKIFKVDSDINLQGQQILNFGDAVISPGVIDVHVHLNEPGREDWEGISTGTTAAALGGITTVIDMPLNSFPVTTVAKRLYEKQALAKDKALVNVGHWAGLTPKNAAQHDVLTSLINAGAVGFKSFMSPSGIDDFPNVGAQDISAALPFLKRAGVPLYVHAEWIRNITEDTISPSPDRTEEGDPTKYSTYQATRPPMFEQDAIRLLIQLLDEDETPITPGFSLHIAHLSDSGSLPLIKEAQGRGHPITVETCAHYLTFSSDIIPQGGTLYKCAPPIRDEANRQALIAAVLDGSINLVSSDHSPAPPELKQLDSGNFMEAWGGISGGQYLLPATWSALRAAGGDLMLLAKVLSSEPAKLSGLQGKKGEIVEGFDADLIVWSPDVDADTSSVGNMHRHKLSPYTDVQLSGQVIVTMVNGRIVHFGRDIQKEPCGGQVIKGRSEKSGKW